MHKNYPFEFFEKIKARVKRIKGKTFSGWYRNLKKMKHQKTFGQTMEKVLLEKMINFEFKLVSFVV